MSDSGQDHPADIPGSPETVPDPTHWFDDDAGPVVRPYAMTRGRTSHSGQHRLDLIALVVAESAADDPVWDVTLSPEHAHILGLCRGAPSRWRNSPPSWTWRSGSSAS